MQHARLLYRHTETAEDIYVETSLYESNVTGSYIIEQVVSGKQTRRGCVVLGQGLAGAMLPLLERISRGEDV